MSGALVRLHPDTYVDSVLLMSATRTMQASPGVEWAGALMGTPANLEDLRAEGFDHGELAKVRSNDLVLAVRARSTGAAEAALAAAERELTERRPAAPPGTGQRRAASIEQALELLPTANLAIVSVPGPYAALEAHRALSAGLHLLLFSDNVSVADEVELKMRGEQLGLLVMGPGAGTAILGGTGLGFANVVRRGSVGVVAAAGTGAQEVVTLLHRWGAGVSDVIAVGGRDLSQEVGGRMTRTALRALRDDPRSDVLLLVSKPPAADVAASVLGEIGSKPAVAAFIGLEQPPPSPGGVRTARTLEEGVRRTLELLGASAPDPSEGLRLRVEQALAGLEDGGRRAIRGLFAGGTLCSEAMVVISDHMAPVYSNVPLRPEWAVPAPPGSHICLDLGDEEFTRGRPHPMIDPGPRAQRVLEAAEDRSVAAILVDVVLGYGAHPNPASTLAPTCREAAARGSRVVAYVLGTEDDPQDRIEQCRQLEEAGCLLAPTAARAALMAAAIASRQPELAERIP